MRQSTAAERDVADGRAARAAIARARTAAAPLTTERPRPPRSAAAAAIAGVITAALGARTHRLGFMTAGLAATVAAVSVAVVVPRVQRRRDCQWLVARTPSRNGRAWVPTIVADNRIRRTITISGHVVLIDDEDDVYLVPRVDHQTAARRSFTPRPEDVAERASSPDTPPR